jgi:hypothetical protein
MDFLEAVDVPDSKIEKDRVTEFLRLLSDDLKTLRKKT